MELGKKILQLRTERGLTQKQLGYMTGLSEPAIRNYELGNRTPDQKQIQKIAKALEVNTEAISEQKDFTNKEAEQVLFLLEDEFDIIPVSGDTGVRIEPKPGSYLYNVVKKWAGYREQLDAGEITEDEYRALKDTFSAGKIMNKGQGLP